MERYKRIINLSWPIVLSYISYHILGVTDLLMVGRLGKEAVAAVGIALTLYWFVVLPLEGLFDSATILFSQAYGSKQLKELRNILFHELGLTILAGLFCIIMFFPLSLGLKFLSPNIEIFKEAKGYLWITTLGLFPYFLNWVLTKFLMSIHDNKYIALFSNITVGINVLLNYILIFGKLGFPSLGVLGSAIGTTIARTIQSLMLAWYCYRVYNRLFTEKSPINFDKGLIKKITSLGLPIAQTNLLEVGSWTLFVGVISKLGVVPLATHEVCMRIKDVAFLPGVALASVVTTLVGNSIGKNDEGEAKAYCYATVWVTIIVMGGFSLLFLIIPETLVKLFNDDPDVVKTGVILLRIMAGYQITDAIFLIFRGALNGVGDTKFVRNGILIGGWFIMLPVAFFFTNILNFGVSGAWIGLTVYVTIIGIAMWIRFAKSSWVREKASH